MMVAMVDSGFRMAEGGNLEFFAPSPERKSESRGASFFSSACTPCDADDDDDVLALRLLLSAMNRCVDCHG